MSYYAAVFRQIRDSAKQCANQHVHNVRLPVAGRAARATGRRYAERMEIAAARSRT